MPIATAHTIKLVFAIFAVAMAAYCGGTTGNSTVPSPANDLSPQADADLPGGSAPSDSLTSVFWEAADLIAGVPDGADFTTARDMLWKEMFLGFSYLLEGFDKYSIEPFTTFPYCMGSMMILFNLADFQQSETVDEAVKYLPSIIDGIDRLEPDLEVSALRDSDGYWKDAYAPAQGLSRCDTFEDEARALRGWEPMKR